MIEFDKPTGHYDQLCFNLDAPSPNISGSFTLPSSIVLQKLPKKSHRAIKKSSVPGDLPMATDRLTIAVQLAKLDVSNSRISQHKVKESRVTLKNNGSEYPNANKQRSKASNNCQTVKISNVASTKVKKSNLQTGVPQSHTKIHNEMIGRHDVNHEKQSPGIKSEPWNRTTKRNRHQQRRIASQDVYTSTADLNADSVYEKSELMQFPKMLHRVVKKEKFKKFYNKRTPNKSGFLSQNRSPSKRSVSNFIKPATVITRQGGSDLQHNIQQYSGAANTNKYNYDWSPPVKLSKCVAVQQTSSNQCETPNDATTSVTSCKYGETHRKLMQKPMKHEHNGVADVLDTTSKEIHIGKQPNEHIDEFIVDNIIEDTVKQLNHMHVDTDKDFFGENVNNEPTIETLFQRLLVMENDERLIRNRWREIKYDDLQHKCHQHTVLIQHKEQDVMQISSTTKVSEQAKKAVDFAPQIYTHSMKRSNNFTMKPFEPSKVKLSLPKSTTQSITKSKSEYGKYLLATFHQPQGNFNPWKVVDDLSRNVVNRIINDVCDEVNEGFEGCVERLFESEFAEPNQSQLHSIIIDHSFHIS